MKTIVLADIHGYLPTITEPFDLMLICGDICPVDQPHTYSVQEEWIRTDFTDWIIQLPFKNEYSKVVFIAGNHDFYFERDNYAAPKIKASTFGRAVYLDNTAYAFEYMDDDGIMKEYTIFGCPYCKPFGNWAFMRENMDKYYDFIPEHLDILICHDAPDINGLGVIESGRWKGENAGNPVLAKYILDRKPKMVFFGHIHSCYGKMVNVDGVQLFGASSVTEGYNPTNPPIIMDIN